MQTLFLATHFNPIYWDTACLIVNSGALENAEDSSDYAKIAKALGEILSANIKVGLIDINHSEAGFAPDVENNQILFGLKGVANVGDDLVDAIIKNRPYVSPKDFLQKVKPNKQAMVALIKGGAFDTMMDRKICMAWYLWHTCDKKSRLTLQNLPSLIKYNLLPEDTEERVRARRIYEFNRYLKSKCDTNKANEFYLLDNRAVNFLDEIGQIILIQQENDDTYTMNKKLWDKNVYQIEMDVFRDWIAADKDEILLNLNSLIFKQEWDKYAQGNYSSWEMEVLCFYFHDHELAKVPYAKYGLSDFFKLPETPVVDKVVGRDIPLYKLTKICGTVISKNKTKSTISLLTPSGVVPVKFRKEYFSLFDKRISERGADGKKHVIESSWFNRGSMLVIQGMRNEDTFISKKYKSTGGHQLYKIDSVDENGNISLRVDRYQGEMEDE